MPLSDFTDAERQRIISELQQSGYPLEHRVATICHAAVDGPPLGSGRFSKTDAGYVRIEADGTHTPIPTPFLNYPQWPIANGAMWSNHRVLYRSERSTLAGVEGTWREIDRALEFQAYITLGAGPKDATIALEAHALIECNHRNNVMLVGFPDPDQGRGAAFPAFGPMARTRLMQRLGQFIRQPCADWPRVNLGGVQQTGSGWHAYAEELIYMATGSLYEYLVTTWSPWVDQDIHPFLRESGMWETLQSQMEHPLFSPSSWIHHHLTDAWCDDFNAAHVNWQRIPPFQLTLPIVCVDMPLLLADSDVAGQIHDLTPTPGFVVEERIVAWPGIAERVLYHPQPRWNRSRGASAVVVHVDHLMEVLMEMAAWARAWEAALADEGIDERLVNHWPLEAAIWDAIGESRE